MRIAVALTLALGLAAGAAFLFAGRALVVVDPLPARADAIVILAGSIPDRVLEAADLYHAHLAPRVIVTRERIRRGELALRARGVRLPEADELTVAALHGLGVPEAATVVLRRRGSSTQTEARTIARYACAHGLGRLVVITWHAHTRRAGLILRRTLGPRIALAVRPTRYDPFSAARWWREPRDAKLVLSEYEKLAHYALRERWRIAPCGGLHPRAHDAPRVGRPPP